MQFAQKVDHRSIYNNQVSSHIILEADFPITVEVKNSIQKSPVNGKNFLQRVFFTWPYQLLSLSEVENIKVSDLSKLPKELMIQREFEHYKNHMSEYSQMGLLKMLLKVFGCELLKLIFLCALVELFYLSFPVLIYYNIDYLQYHKENISYGIGLFSATIIVSFCYNLTYTNLKYLFKCLGTDVSTYLNLLIYDKTLRYSFSSNKKYSESDIISYSQIDTDNMMYIGSKLSYFFFGIFQLFAGFGLLYWFIGYAFVAGLVVLVFISAVTFIISSCSVNLGEVALSKKDERLSATEQLLNIIRFVKQNAYEKIYFKKIKEWREKELEIYQKKGIIEAVTILLYFLTVPCVLTAIILTYIYINGQMTPSKVFSTMMIAVIFQVTAQQFPKVISELIAILNSIKRIGEFLSTHQIKINKSHKEQREYAISIKNGEFYIKSNSLSEMKQKQENKYQIVRISQSSPNKNSSVAPDNLMNMTNEVLDVQNIRNLDQFDSNQSQSDNTIVLKNINLNIEKGKLYMIFGDIGSGKSALLLSILNEFNKKKQSEVEINGKVAYVSQKPWIFSGTIQSNIQFLHQKNESRLQEAIKNACLQDDLKLLSKGIQTQIGENGINLSGGQKFRVDLARSLYSDSDIYLFDDILSAVDIHVATFIMQNAVKKYLSNKTVILATHAIKFAEMADYIILLNKGEVVACQTYETIRNTEYFQKIENIILNSKELKEKVKIQRQIEQNIIKEAIQSSKHFSEVGDNEKASDQDNEQIMQIQTLILPQDKQRGEVNFNMFKQYVKYNGGFLCYLLPILICLILYTVFQTAASIIISQWSETNDQYYLHIFIGITLSASVFIFFQALILTFSGVKQGKSVHNNIIKGLLYASLIKFFNRVPLGRILNRLSKDLKELDEVIGNTFCSSLTSGFKILAAIFISIYTSTPYALIPIVIVFFCFIKIRKMYISAQNELIRLEKSTNSPLVIGFTNGIRGAPLIRSYKCEEKFLNTYIENVNNYRRVLYNRYALGGWFILVLVYLTYLINMFSIGFCMFGPTMNPSYIGLLLTYILNFNDQLYQFVLDETEFETQLISLQRLYKLMNLPPEEKYTKYCEQWSEVEEKETQVFKSGKIEFKNLSVRYRKDLPKVLNDLNVVIESGMKIGVVGRTGSGKSTILNTLLEIIQPSQGEILVDDIPLSQVQLKDLRKSITVIDQEPVLLNSTFRENIDIFNEYSDGELQKVMKECNIYDIVSSRGGIDGKVCNSSLSAGQKQLICICRAVLKHTKIVLIDEATANIDVKNDTLIQKVILEKFSGKTVLMIAHRLSTLSNYDRIMVMEAGRLIQYDSPDNLMLTKGVYYEMVRKYNAANQ